MSSLIIRTLTLPLIITAEYMCLWINLNSSVRPCFPKNISCHWTWAMQKETNYYHPHLFVETEFIKRSWFCCVTSSGWMSTVLPLVHVLFIFTWHTSFIRVLCWIYLTRVLEGNWIAQWRFFFFSLSEVRIKEVDRRINAAIVRAGLLSRLQKLPWIIRDRPSPRQ